MMPFDKAGAYLVTTRDRHLFRCHVDEVGRDRERRWIFQAVSDTDSGAAGETTAYIGPPWFPVAHEGELREMVDEWWEMKKALGQVD